MSSNTIINLPLHMRSDHLVKVLGALVGEPFDTKLKNKHWGGLANPKQPAEKDINPWTVEFRRKAEDGFGMTPVEDVLDPLSMGRLSFHDMADQRHSWCFFQETGEGFFKCLMPDKSALAIAVGKRLLAVFGGELEFDGEISHVDLVVHDKKALFPARVRGCDPDEGYYQMQTIVGTITPISVAELRQAMDDAGERHTQETDTVLLDRLVFMEDAIRLDAATPQVGRRTNDRRL